MAGSRVATSGKFVAECVLMKTIYLLLVSVVLSGFSQAQAQTSFFGRIRSAFDSTKETVGTAAQSAGRVSRAWVTKAKENFRLTRPEYTQRADKRITAAATALEAIKQGKSGVMNRRYFKTRIAALEEHLGYARLEYSYLQASPTEEVFRERQKSFDFTVWSLEEAISLSESEAGF